MSKENSFKTFIRQFPHCTESAYELAAPYLKRKSVKK